MAEWMENVEKSISRIMADKVYTSAEFKRERDNFHVSLEGGTAQYLKMKGRLHHITILAQVCMRCNHPLFSSTVVCKQFSASFLPIHLAHISTC